jgi:DNA-binding transcriptional ArsR family regulator
MVDQLSTTFAASPTPRRPSWRSLQGECSVTETRRAVRNEPPAVSKHLRVLERAGLIARGRQAQWRPCRIEAGPLREVANWAERYRNIWEQRFDRLDKYLQQIKTKEEKRHGHQRRGKK